MDLRIDAADQPIPALRELLNRREANDAMVRAERALRRSEAEAARSHLAKAIRLGAGWDRIWRRVARLDATMGDESAALQALAVFANLNPAWARTEGRDPIYEALWREPRGAQWRTYLTGREGGE